MKKAHCCVMLASLTAAAGVHAQSSLTLYGIVDEALAYVSNEAPAAGKPGSRNFKTLTGGLSGDRWGFKGDEDLGAGLHAIFTLENGFSGYTGAAAQGGRLFGRQSFVGLASKTFGTFTMGRQYDFGYDFLAPFMSWTQFTGPFGAHVGDNDNFYQTIRSNNSVKYQTPNWYGFTAGALYGFSNQAAGPDGQGFANNRDYSIGVAFANGPVRVAANYLRLDHPSSASTTNPNGAVGQYTLGGSSIFYNTSPVRRQAVISAGGAYNIAPVTIAFIFSDTKLDYVDGSRLHLDNYEVNAKVMLGPAWLVGLGYIYTDGSANGGMSIKPFATGNSPAWHQIDFGVEYLLSKRTTLHFATVAQFATRDATVAAINYDGAVSGSNSYKQIGVVVGLRQTF